MRKFRSRIVTTSFGRNAELNKVMAWKLREARFYNGKITQIDLAKRLKTSQSCISRAESGNIASVRWWLKAIKACGSNIQFHISLETEQA